MYLLALGKKPIPKRTAALKAFLDQQAELHGRLDDRAWSDLGHVLVNMKDFIFLK